MGRCKRSRVERSVGKEELLKMWLVVSSDRMQGGQEGEGGRLYRIWRHVISIFL